MESVAGSALCATPEQASDKTFNLDYYRGEIRGAPDAPGCSTGLPQVFAESPHDWL